jgi:hypothetical protein
MMAIVSGGSAISLMKISDEYQATYHRLGAQARLAIDQLAKSEEEFGLSIADESELASKVLSLASSLMDSHSRDDINTAAEAMAIRLTLRRPKRDGGRKKNPFWTSEKEGELLGIYDGWGEDVTNKAVAERFVIQNPDYNRPKLPVRHYSWDDSTFKEKKLDAENKQMTSVAKYLGNLLSEREKRLKEWQRVSALSFMFEDLLG